ncbi:MAG: exo-alpha-sialidase [Actinobacteria bacterium]|nr:MAG: exo-alpha-sialidase [Actinomycetota bacterium]
MRILVGTDDGLHEFGDRSSPGSVQHAGRKVSALAPGPDYSNLWAILDEAEVWRTDGPGDWARNATLEGEHLRANCIADTRPGVLVGASDARLYRVGGEGLERVQPFDKVEGRDDWYTPWGGPPDARSISEDSNFLYVNVHVGGVVRSEDEGATWEPTIDIDADVHRVWAVDGRVLAACARGLAVSEDRGASWAIRTEGLHAVYCRGVALSGDTVLVSASTGPRGGRSALYRGAARGGAFERCRSGLPEWFEHNIDSLCLDALPDEGAAAFGTEDGRVFGSGDEGATWTEMASGLPAARCVLLTPG